MNFFRALGRSVQLAGMFVSAGTELAVKRPKTRAARADWLHRFAAGAMRRMGIEIRVTGAFPERGAVISNHLSYLDIVVFAALHPCVFVSKAEIAEWPVLGWMTTMSGTVYVARGHGGSAMKARRGMQSVVDAGLPVVFFPGRDDDEWKYSAEVSQRTVGSGDDGWLTGDGGLFELQSGSG